MTASEYSEALEVARELANHLRACDGRAARAIRMGATLALHWRRGSEFCETVRDVAVGLYADTLRTQTVQNETRRQQ